MRLTAPVSRKRLYLFLAAGTMAALLATGAVALSSASPSREAGASKSSSPVDAVHSDTGRKVSLSDNASGLVQNAALPVVTVSVQGVRNVALDEQTANAASLGAGARVIAHSGYCCVGQDPEQLIDNLAGTAWTGGASTPDHVVIELAQGQTFTIDRVRVQPRAADWPDQRVRDFEVWTSNTGFQDADFALALSATAADSGALQEFNFPGGGVEAKYVKFVALNNRGDCCYISTSAFQAVATQDVGPGGITSASSEADAGHAARNVLDSRAASQWTTATGQADGQHFTLLLQGGQSHLVRGIGLDSDGSTKAPKDFQVWLSDTTVDGSSFVPVFSSTLTQDAGEQLFWFTATQAKYARIVLLNNFGDACCITLEGLRVFAVVPAQADGWLDTDALVTMAPGEGSGADHTEYSTDAGADWATYTGPFMHGAHGSTPVWSRTVGTAQDTGPITRTFVSIDKTPKVSTKEAGQAGLDWLTPAARNKSLALDCAACHVQGDVLHGLAIASASGFAVNESDVDGAGWLANFITDPRYQRPSDGLWPFPRPGEGTHPVAVSSSHALFGLALYDRLVSSNKSAEILKAVEGMLALQQPDGRWALDQWEPPVNTSDIVPTAHMVFALGQAVARADADGAGTFRAALDDAVEWLKTSPLSENPAQSQDRALKLIALIEAGVPKSDPGLALLRNELLAAQLPDGSFADDDSEQWPSAFATGQVVYAMCLSGISRADPRVAQAIDWLVHSQAGHTPDDLVAAYMHNGPWTARDLHGRSSPLVTTVWPVIALGCYGDVGLDLTLAPAAQQLAVGAPGPQSTSFTGDLTNTGLGADTFSIAVSGALAGWTASPSSASVQLAAGASSQVSLAVNAPSGLSAEQTFAFTVTATSQEDPDVKRSVLVLVTTGEAPATTAATETRITSGAGAVLPVDDEVVLAARVKDTTAGTDVAGAGIVTFTVGGIAVGSAGDGDGDGTFSFTWKPGDAWALLGSQTLQASFSGADRPEPALDLLPSSASGAITLGPPVNDPPEANAGPDQTVQEGQVVVLDGSGSTDDGLTEPLTFTWRDGASIIATGETASLVLEVGAHIIILDVFDGEHTSSDSLTVEVEMGNVPPEASGEAAASSLEGTLRFYGVIFTDLNSADVHTVTANWGDGSGPQGMPVVESNGAGSASLKYSYAESGAYTAVFEVCDQDAACDTVTTNVTVVNAGPAVNPGSGRTMPENTLHTQPISVTDAGIVDTHSGEVNWGDGSAAEALTIVAEGGSISATPSHLYTDNGVFNAAFKVCDDEGTCTTVTATMTVQNVAPVVNAGPDQSLPAAAVVSLPPATFTDASPVDTHTAIVNWGDGGPAEPATVAQGAGLGAVMQSHSYATGGQYNVTVCVTDDDGGVGCDSFVVTLPILPPTTNCNTTLRLTLLTSTYQFNTTPVPNGPAGTFTFMARIANIGQNGAERVSTIITQLTGGNLLLNGDSGPGGVGATLTVPPGGAYADGILGPGESVDVFYVIGLATSQDFNFFVDVFCGQGG